MVNVAAIQGRQLDSLPPQFFNASSVEDYLRRIGTFTTDQDIIQINIHEVLLNAPSVVPGSALNPLPFDDGSTSTFQYANATESFGQAPNSSLSYSYDDQSSLAGLSCNVQDFFSFHIVLANEGANHFQSHVTTQSRDFVSVNKNLLLQNLSRNFFCLGNGPGYTLEGVHEALVASVV